MRTALILVTGMALSPFALGEPNLHLQKDRREAVKNYIQALEAHDADRMIQLFSKNGKVVSTSKGEVDATVFFTGFLPQVLNAQTELKQLFVGKNPFFGANASRMAARFHLAFKLKDGEAGAGEYMDEFVFEEHSDKLAAVYMFENLKFQNDVTK